MVTTPAATAEPVIRFEVRPPHTFPKHTPLHTSQPPHTHKNVYHTFTLTLTRQVGQCVNAKFPDNGRFYGAFISKVNAKTYDVYFTDDGTSPSSLRHLQTPSHTTPRRLPHHVTPSHTTAQPPTPPRRLPRHYYTLPHHQVARLYSLPHCHHAPHAATSPPTHHHFADETTTSPPTPSRRLPHHHFASHTITSPPTPPRRLSRHHVASDTTTSPPRPSRRLRHRHVACHTTTSPPTPSYRL